jgi:hypothetical protein
MYLKLKRTVMSHYLLQSRSWCRTSLVRLCVVVAVVFRNLQPCLVRAVTLRREGDVIMTQHINVGLVHGNSHTSRRKEKKQL